MHACVRVDFAPSVKLFVYALDPLHAWVALDYYLSHVSLRA